MTMFGQIAFATAAVTAGSVAQAADAGSGVSTGAQSDPSSAATPHQGDATLRELEVPRWRDAAAVAPALRDARAAAPKRARGDRQCRLAAALDRRQRRGVADAGI
jgi:hypothetical protein